MSNASSIGLARQCYICLESVSMQQLQSETNKWVSPCRCAGTMAWVHQACILRWVREQENHQTVTPACPQCRTTFILTPEKTPLIRALDTLYKRIIPACKVFGGSVITIIAFDAACACLGIFSLAQIHGLDEVLSMIQTGDSLETLAHVHLISYSLILINYVPWEDFLLRILRKSSRLPLLGMIFPSDVRNRFQIFPTRKSWKRVVGGAVLLPVFARIVGEMLFLSMESDVKRVLVGGATFLAVKGLISMYLDQKLLTRRQQIEIAPVN